MSTGANLFKVTRAIDGRSISAIMASAAIAGTLVVTDPASVVGQTTTMNPSLAFMLATGKARAALLERQVLGASSVPLDQLVFGNALLTPEPLGACVSARIVEEYEVEGPGLILAKGSSISIATVATGNPTPITTTTPHGLVTGELVTIAGVSGNTPSGINGTFAVTVTGTTTFTIPLNTTVAGTGGTVIPTQGLDASTALNSEVTNFHGMLALRSDTATQESFGRVRGILTAQDSLNATRLLIEVNQ